MIKTESSLYACGTYFCYEMRGPQGDRVLIRYWVESLPGGMGSQPEESLEIPLKLVLDFAEKYHAQKQKKVGRSKLQLKK